MKRELIDTTPFNILPYKLSYDDKETADKAARDCATMLFKDN